MRQFCVQQFKNKFLAHFARKLFVGLSLLLNLFCRFCLLFTILTAYSQFGQLIQRKIIKIVVARCHILMLKCTKFDFGWGSVPDRAGELTSLPQTL